MKRADMEAQIKSRSRAVPKSVGRQVGVLPIETRKPIPPRLPPSSSSTGTRFVVKTWHLELRLSYLFCAD